MMAGAGAGADADDGVLLLVEGLESFNKSFFKDSKESCHQGFIFFASSFVMGESFSPVDGENS